VNPIRVVIAEDQAPAREHLVAAAEAESDFAVVAVAQDGRAAIDAIRSHPADLVFLDIQMPETDGFDVLQAVGPARMPPVIFVSAYDRAVRAFEVRALDYLLKPFTSARLSAAFDLARAHVRERRRIAGRAPAAAPLEVRRRDRILFVPPEEIESVEARRNDVVLRTGSEHFRARSTLASMLRRLGPPFVQTHRSTLVNLDLARPVFLRRSRRLLLKSGRSVPVSARLVRAIAAALRRRAEQGPA
jgi:two-component system LytT family response regulator